ncbi:MAG: hypothetical protein ACXAE3_17540 [Candidatus Kariarchaeaceae archaeon]
MEGRDLGYQSLIDAVLVFIYLMAYSEFIGIFLELEIGDPIMGNMFFYISGIVFYGLLAVYLNLVGDYLDLYGMIRIFVPAFLVITVIDLFDYIYTIVTGGTAFGTFLTVVGVVVYMPVFAMLRLIFPGMIFFFFYYFVKWFPSFRRGPKYVKYLPTIRQVMDYKRQN